MEEEKKEKKTVKKSRLALKIIAFVLIAVIAGAGTGVIMNMIPRTEKTAPIEIVENPNAAIRVPAEEEHYIFDLDESVERTHVYYNNRFGIEIAADLYMAKDADAGKKYPAITSDPDNIPETMNLMGTTIGRIYNADAMSFDIYDVMKDYPKDVLIIHGTRDSIVPISYSERAAEVFPSAELVKFEGAGHGFYGDDEMRSAQMAVEFVKEHLGNVETSETVSAVKDEEGTEEMKIRVSDGTNEVTFLLNDSSASKSLYDQLPLTIEVENYSSNEKIFYPPEKLDTSDVIESDGPFGTLAYFSPWGNVVMYYSECGEYPGLYIMGEAIEGADLIEKLSGKISVTVLDAE